MYEHRSQKPISSHHFTRRVLVHALIATGLVAVSLVAGMIGYHFTEGLGWLDAFLNASMLLGGMGPVDAPKSDAGKAFAGFYALYAGLVFLIAAGVVIVPMFHRMLHVFHWQEDKNT
jgi:hypothetical protein